MILTDCKDQILQYVVEVDDLDTIDVDFKGWKPIYVAADDTLVIDFFPILNFTVHAPNSVSLETATVDGANKLIEVVLPKLGNTTLEFDDNFTGQIIFFLVK